MFIDVDRKLVLRITDEILKRLESPKFETFVGQMFDRGKKVQRFRLEPVRVPTKSGTLTLLVLGSTQYLPQDKRLVYSASYSHLKGKPAGILKVVLNLASWWRLEADRQRVRRNLYVTVLHELTHAMDELTKKETPVDAEEAGLAAYYNTRAEVAARLNEMLFTLEEDFEEIVQEAKRFSGSPEGKIFKALMEHWDSQLIRDYSYYTPENKALVWRAFLKKIKVLLAARPRAIFRKAFFGFGPSKKLVVEQKAFYKALLSELFAWYGEYKASLEEIQHVRREAERQAKRRGWNLILSDTGLLSLERHFNTALQTYRKELIKSLRVLDSIELSAFPDLAQEIKLARATRPLKPRGPTKETKKEIKEVKKTFRNFEVLLYTTEVYDVLVALSEDVANLQERLKEVVASAGVTVEPFVPIAYSVAKIFQALGLLQGAIHQAAGFVDQETAQAMKGEDPLAI